MLVSIIARSQLPVRQLRLFSNISGPIYASNKRVIKPKSSPSPGPTNPLSRYDTPLTAAATPPPSPSTVAAKSRPRAKDSLRSQGNDDFRMALVVRTDLKMEKGKIAAQCAHAAVQNFRQLQRLDPGLINAWEMTGQAKIALKCSSLNELELLAARATDLGVLACFVRDAGRTQVMAGEVTVLGLGPARREVLDRITKDLKLY